MNAITLATISSVTTDRRPVVQRGMKGWIRGEPMAQKVARRRPLSNHFEKNRRKKRAERIPTAGKALNSTRFNMLCREFPGLQLVGKPAKSVDVNARFEPEGVRADDDLPQAGRGVRRSQTAAEGGVENAFE